VVGCGTVFKITPDGVFTTLYYFCSQSDCTHGANPVAGLVQGADGSFYGTTYTGGGAAGCVGGCGTVFKITPGGALTTLYSFCSESNCPDGQFPNAALVQGTDGNFYGTTSEGGGTGGTVFKITPDGQLTTLYSFCSESGCADGGLVNAGLVQGKDGSFYGTTTFGGAHAVGTVFKISPDGLLTTLYSFCSRGVAPWCTDGQRPYGGLIQASDRKFYGTTQGRLINGCTTTCGTVFSFGTGLDLRPSLGKVGKQITSVGLNLTGASCVTFRGVAATFTVASGTQIVATVPAGATTGRVRVTTPGGVLTSNAAFMVRPQIKSFKPNSGPVGTTVTIAGVSLRQTTQVTFGGVLATNFKVNSDTQVTAAVPTGAETGKVGIATAGGTALSWGTFTVTQ
jgi:uncharacterized repeat protein (TIGR03803 family)